jgi:hypothetical protein
LCLSFHAANAAVLLQLGEMLGLGDEKNATTFMSACIIVTQAVIMCSAAWIGGQAIVAAADRCSWLALAFAYPRGALHIDARNRSVDIDSTPSLDRLQAP